MFERISSEWLEHRVEGHGSATIHDVTLSTMEPPPVVTTSEKLTSLESEQTKTAKALLRSQRALESLDTYLHSLDSQHLDVSKLQSIVESYDATAEKLDTKITELEGTRKRLEEEIEEEKKELAGPKGNTKLRLKSTIEVFANFEGEVEVALIYGAFRSMPSARVFIQDHSCQQRDLVCTIRHPCRYADEGEAYQFDLQGCHYAEHRRGQKPSVWNIRPNSHRVT